MTESEKILEHQAFNHVKFTDLLEQPDTFRGQKVLTVAAYVVTGRMIPSSPDVGNGSYREETGFMQDVTDYIYSYDLNRTMNFRFIQTSGESGSNPLGAAKMSRIYGSIQEGLRGEHYFHVSEVEEIKEIKMDFPSGW
ncbi:MAG TPA: hypothetical protein VLF68_04090 [Candidatus Saccharimonadales bacterium]|nr:hypothetical protein [Candidatus Saccharimonadales bacterium]